MAEAVDTHCDAMLYNAQHASHHTHAAACTAPHSFCSMRRTRLVLQHASHQTRSANSSCIRICYSI
eukprot:13130681-Alexandrium_andersonii.AAC.1